VSRTNSIAPVFSTRAALALAQDLKEFESESRNHTRERIALHHTRTPPGAGSLIPHLRQRRSVDDPEGKTGLAHMFEHMAFKGTETIGTKNWVEEKNALAAVEEIYDRLEAEQRKAPCG